MKILIDINHPAHIHYFRNFYFEMCSQGHEILLVTRNKEITIELLSLYNIPYINRGVGYDGRLGKFVYMIYADIFLLKLALKFKPDVFLNFLHPYPSHVATIMNVPSLVFSDTEHASLHHKLTVPFASKIFTPDCYRIDIGSKQIRFKGFMELAYLHPNYFSPDSSILSLLGVEEGEKYVIVRFVSWAAAHDFGHNGMSLENKRKAIMFMSQYAKVFITSERELPEDLVQFQIQIPFDRIHDALYFSSLLFGESATMASESAVLGTPAIFIDNDGRGYTDRLQTEYSLVYNFKESEEDQEKAILKSIEILKDENSKQAAGKSRARLLAESIDTTEFMMEVVLKENR
jgi:predicted glycosyltransferase